MLSVGHPCCECEFWPFRPSNAVNQGISGRGFIRNWVISGGAMKRLIDRKLYDTDQAEQITRYAPNTYRGDFNYLIETLYKTPDGEYILHCEGGAATEYAKPCDGGGKTSGEELNVLDEEAVLDWCEDRKIDGSIVVSEFEHLIET